METPDGPREAAAEEGVYRLAAPWTEKGGHFDLIVTVTDGEQVDVLPVTIDVPEPQASLLPGAGGASWFGAFGVHTLLLAGRLVVVALALVRRRGTAAAIILLAAGLGFAGDARAHEGDDHGTESAAPAGARDAPQRQPDGSVFVPKTSQRLLAIRTVVTEKREYFKAIELPGRIITDPNASGYVQSALAGRLSPPPKGFLSSARGSRRARCSPMSRRPFRRLTPRICGSGKRKFSSSFPSWSGALPDTSN